MLNYELHDVPFLQFESAQLSKKRGLGGIATFDSCVELSVLGVAYH